MPADVWSELQKNNLVKAYENRPPYQRNDYIGWIEQAKRSETRLKRIDQMIEELRARDVYMKMAWGKSTDGRKPKKASNIDEFVQESGELFGDLIKKLDKCINAIDKYESKAAWGGWAYKIGSNYSCMIVRYKSHVKLMIWRGIILNDPKKLLQGAGSNTQHLRFESIDNVDCSYLTTLLSQQKELYNSGMTWEG